MPQNISGNNRHAGDFIVDRYLTTLSIFGSQRNNNPPSANAGALIVCNGDVGFGQDLRVGNNVYASSFEGFVTTIFTSFQLANGGQEEGYVLTADSGGFGTWKTPLWWTNDVPQDNNAPTDNVIWTEHDVGIGITGTIQSPTERLHVSTTTAGEGARFGNLTVGNWTSNSSYSILTHNSLKSDVSAYGLKLRDTGETHLNGRDEIQLRIDDVMAVTVNSNRYVGIGTSTPEEMLHITENVKIGGNLEVLGNTTTINTETLTIEDNMIKFASGNIGDTTDFGFYGLYIDSGVTKFSGLYRDASENDKLYKLFTNLSTEPTNTIINSDLAMLRLNGLEVEVGVTFDPNGRINHEEVVFSGGTSPNYTDQIYFKSDGKLGIGTANPNVLLEVIGDVNTEGNLGIGISLPNANYSIDTDRTDAYRLPTGNSAERPVPPIVGLFRFNTDGQIFEGYYDDGAGDAGWRTTGVVIDTDFDTFIEPELTTDDDHLRFYTEGVESMTIRNHTSANGSVTSGINNGNVGVGITQPFVKFQIEGTDAIKIPIGTTAQRPITLEDGQIRYNTSLQIYEGYSTKYSQWETLNGSRDGDKDTYITVEETVDEDCIRFYTQGTQRMIIKNDGTDELVGIGVTTDPIYSLEIRDDGAMLIPVGDSGTRPLVGENGLIRYNTQKGVYEGYKDNVGWKILQDPISDNDGDTSIFVETFIDEDKIRFTSDGVQRMVIDSNGFIGIGISTPSKELDVVGDMCLSGSLDIGTDLVVEGDFTVNGTTVTNNVDTLLVEDPLIKLSTNNGTDAVDIGFYALYDGLGVSKYTGLVRDATDSYYTLFEDLTVDPLTNIVDFADVGITRADLRVDIIDTNFVDFPGTELRIRGSSGSSEKVIITSEPYLGVNIYPQYPLHVTTSNISGWSARIKNGVGSDLFLANTDGQGIMLNTKVTSGNANYAVCFKNNTFSTSSPLLQIMNDGKIGIHTSAPEDLLHISTTTAGEGINFGDETKTNAYGFLGLYDSSNAYVSFGNIGGSLTHATDYAIRQGTSGNTLINAATSQNIEFRHNNSTTATNTVYIDANGNVGIGSNTPAAELDVVGDVQIVESSASFAVRIDNDTTSIDMAHNDGSGILVDSDSSYAFKATDGATNNFIVTNSGLLGINTDTPSERIHVDTAVAGEGAKIGVAQVGNHITDSPLTAVFAHCNVYDEPDSFGLKQNEDGKTTLNSKYGQDICFTIDNDQLMVLDQDGKLGIGVTIPTNALDVLGNTKLDGDVLITGELTFSGPFVESLTFQDNLLKLAGDNTTDVLDIGFYGCYVELGDTKFAGTFYDASDNVWRMFDDLEVEPGITVNIDGPGYTASKLVVGDEYVINNLGVGIENPSFQLDVLGVVRAQDYITHSDQRSKDIICKLNEKESYKQIKKLDVYKYTLKSDETNRERDGFIAQELNEIMPSATIKSRMIIDGEEVDDYIGVDQYSIIANLTNALKYAIQKIEKLEEEVLSLKVKNSLNQL